MRRIRWMVGAVSACALHGWGSNFYWQGAGAGGSGDYEVPANWTSNSVPGESDLVAFKNQGSQNWAVALNSDPTNTVLLFDVPTQNYQTFVNLNQHVWTSTEAGLGLYVRFGSGGRVTFSNGTFRLVYLNGQSAPLSGTTPTNHTVTSFQNVRSSSGNADFAGTLASLDGGEHVVANRLRVGTLSGASSFATLNLLNGTQVAVTNEVHIGGVSGSTGQVNVADAFLGLGRSVNYLGAFSASKGTLKIGPGAKVWSSGSVFNGYVGQGVIEQTGGSLIVSNGCEIGVNGGARGELTLRGGQFTVADLRPSATNYLRVATNPGSTGEVTLAGGHFSYVGETTALGRSGYGKMTVSGGTNVLAGNVLVGTLAGGVGELAVFGGANTFCSAAGTRLQVGGYGRGALLGLGGTNSALAVAVANDGGSAGAMTVSNGLWTIAEHMWVGYSGIGTLTVGGGEIRFLNGGPVLSIGRAGVATGEVTVAGGLVDMVSNGSVWVGRADQTATKVSGRLVLTGNGVLRTKQVFEYAAGPNATSQVLFDGGTLQASSSGLLVYALDDVRLTANGMVIDSAGYTVSVATVLQNAAGEAGGITKKGAGTLTLAGSRLATGPVSVLGGTLVVSNEVAVSAGTSRIDGALTLTSANRLTVGAGAALAGTGSVSRVTLQNNAVFARNKASGAVAPLSAGDCVAEERMTVELAGYSLLELITPVQLIRAPTAFVAPAKVAVTLNGQPNPCLRAKFVEAGGQQILAVSYSTGTLISVM